MGKFQTFAHLLLLTIVVTILFVIQLYEVLADQLTDIIVNAVINTFNSFRILPPLLKFLMTIFI
jgi:hypothetical protein